MELFVKMKCIKCQREMNKFVYNNIIIDQCSHCGSIWLDKHEFPSLVQKLNRKYINKDVENFQKCIPSRNQKEIIMMEKYLENFFNNQSINSANRCPRCGDNLKRVNLYDVPIEYCNSCNGMFFDKLEFENIYLKILNKQSLWKKIKAKIKSLFSK